jgi:hypothetical protein
MARGNISFFTGEAFNRVLSWFGIKIWYCDDIERHLILWHYESEKNLSAVNRLLSAVHAVKKHLYGKCRFNDRVLNDYAGVFIRKFGRNFENSGKEFIVRIWYSGETVGMFFDVVKNRKFAEKTVWKDCGRDEILKKIKSLKNLSTAEIDGKEDIKGFEREYFYVFKPNRKHLWNRKHSVMDMYEFHEAIMKAGRDGK